MLPQDVRDRDQVRASQFLEEFTRMSQQRDDITAEALADFVRRHVPEGIEVWVDERGAHRRMFAFLVQR